MLQKPHASGLWLGIVLLSLTFARSTVLAQAPLTTIRAVQELSPEEAARGQQVEVRGVVTYYERRWDALFVQDATSGSYVFSTDKPRPPLIAGQQVLLRGRVHPNGPRAAVSIREESLT